MKKQGNPGEPGPPRLQRGGVKRAGGTKMNEQSVREEC